MTGCHKCKHTGYAFARIPCECADKESANLDRLSKRLEKYFSTWAIAYNNGQARASDIMLCFPDDKEPIGTVIEKNDDGTMKVQLT